MSLADGTPDGYEDWLRSWYASEPPPASDVQAAPSPVVEAVPPPAPEATNFSDEAFHNAWLGAMRGEMQPPAPDGVDAVSGAAPVVPGNLPADVAPPPQEQPQAPSPEQAPPDLGEPSPYFDPIDMRTWTSPVSTPDLVDMAHRDPVAFAQHAQAMQDARNAEEARLVAEAKRKDAEREEQNYRDMQDAQAQAAKARDEVANTRINPNHWRESRSVPQSIAAFLSVVVGGLVQSRKGGPNIGLEIIDRAIDRDIAAQEANLANKRSAMRDLLDQGMSRFQAQQAYRVASYARALDDIKTTMQSYDPKGTAAMGLAQQALQIEGRMAAAAEAARRQGLDEMLRRNKDARETAETMAKLREADLKAAKLAGGMGGGVGVVQPGNLTAQQVRDQIGDPKFPVPDVPGGYTPARAKQMVELAKSGREVRQFETEEDRKLGLLGPDGAPLAGKDGKPVRMRSPEVAEEMTKGIVATDKAVRLMDELLALRAKYGWSSDLLQSPEWRKMKANWGDLILQKKNIEKLGALSESDMNLVTDSFGAKDPTGMRDPTAGLMQARRNTVLGMQGELRTRGVADESIPKYPALVDLDKAGRLPGDHELEVALGYGMKDPKDPYGSTMIASPDQKKIIAEWKANLGSEDPGTREQARRGLTLVANGGGIPETKKLATEALGTLLTDLPPTSTEEPSIGGRAVARETVPPLPTKKKDEKPKKPVKTDSAGNPI